jgi:hypothetical protein
MTSETIPGPRTSCLPPRRLIPLLPRASLAHHVIRNWCFLKRSGICGQRNWLVGSVSVGSQAFFAVINHGINVEESLAFRIRAMRFTLKTFALVPLTLFATASSTPGFASDLETELRDINQYSEQTEAPSATSFVQVTDIGQFSDVQPTDWPYSALQSLVETYGCLAGSESSRLDGSRSITRYEAAALLKACLDRVTTNTDQLKRLTQEFQEEVSLLNARADSLQSRVANLEDIQFSPTTRLQVSMAYIFGGTGYSGAGAQAVSSGSRNLFLPNNFGDGGNPTDGISMNYDIHLYLNTSFTGKDLLLTRLETGNFTNSAFGLRSATPISYYSWLFPISVNQSDNDLYLSRLYYRFPVGDQLTLVVAARARQDDLLGTWPGTYPSDFPLFGNSIYAGSPGAYNLNIGPGASIIWKKPLSSTTSLIATGLYVASLGDQGNSNSGGLGTANSAASGSAQMSFVGSTWNISGVWTYNQPGVYLGMGTPLYNQPTLGATNSYGLGGYYVVGGQNSLIPILNWGAGVTQFSTGDPYNRSLSGSWYTALVWTNLLSKGQDLGFSVSQPTFIIRSNDGTPSDGGFAFDAYYKFTLSDHITLTPALQWGSRPYGQMTDQITGTPAFSTLAFMLKMGFKF